MIKVAISAAEVVDAGEALVEALVNFSLCNKALSSVTEVEVEAVEEDLSLEKSAVKLTTWTGKTNSETSSNSS
jgi:hypothetical protein